MSRLDLKAKTAVPFAAKEERLEEKGKRSKLKKQRTQKHLTE